MSRRTNRSFALTDQSMCRRPIAPPANNLHEQRDRTDWGEIDADLAGLVALGTPVSLLAQDVSPGPSAQGDLSVTIYNNDVALVQAAPTRPLLRASGHW